MSEMQTLVKQININTAPIHVMLGLLPFASTLHINLNDLDL